MATPLDLTKDQLHVLVKALHYSLRAAANK